jgi:hypothetical protein
MYTARSHAVMGRPDGHTNAPWLEYLVDRICDLRRQLFLDLQTFRVNFNNAGELADPNHPAIRDVSHPRPTQNRGHVMFARAFKANAPQRDHLVISLYFVERFLKDYDRVLSVADKGPSNARVTRAGVSIKPLRSGLSPLHRMMVRTAASTSGRSDLPL